MASHLSGRLSRLEKSAPADAPGGLVDLVHERLHRPLPGGGTVLERLREEFADVPPPGPGATAEYRTMHALFATRTTDTEETDQ